MSAGRSGIVGVLCVFASDVYWLAMTENAIAGEIVDVAFRVPTGLGPGLFESVCEAILANELEKCGPRGSAQPVGQQAIWAVNRFQRGWDQRWDHQDCQ